MKPSWAESKVLASAGIDPIKAKDWEISIAAQALTRCYYIDLAAEEFLRILRGPLWKRVG